MHGVKKLVAVWLLAGVVVSCSQADTHPGVIGDCPKCGTIFIFGGGGDSGTNDATVNDTGTVDTGIPDTGIPDTGILDTGILDTGILDTGILDTGILDTGGGG